MDIVTDSPALIRFADDTAPTRAAILSQFDKPRPRVIHIDAPAAPVVFDPNSCGLAWPQQVYIRADMVILNNSAFDMGDLETLDIRAHYGIFIGNWALNCPNTLHHVRLRAPHIVMRPFALYGACPKITVGGRTIRTAPYYGAHIIADHTAPILFDGMDKNMATYGEIPVQQAMFAHGITHARYASETLQGRRVLHMMDRYIVR